MCGLWPELFFCDSDAAGLCHPLRTLGAVAEGQKPPLFSSFSPSFSFILLFWTNAIENGSNQRLRKAAEVDFSLLFFSSALSFSLYLTIKK